MFNHTSEPVPTNCKLDALKTEIENESRAYTDENHDQHGRYIRLLKDVLEKCLTSDPSTSNYAASGLVEEKGEEWSLRLNKERIISHSYKSYCIDSKFSPDFTMFNSKFSHDNVGVVTMIELLVDKTIDNSHLMPTMRYNTLVLASQPMRPHIISAVTNIKNICFVKTIKDDQYFKHQITNKLQIFYGNHLELFVEMLLNDSANGHVSNSLDFTQVADEKQRTILLKEFIGMGRTARVFGTNENDTICKVFKPQYGNQFQHELNILRGMANAPSSRLCHLIGLNEPFKSLLIGPRGYSGLKKNDSRVIL